MQLDVLPTTGTCCAGPSSTTATATAPSTREVREAYDRGNGVSILLHDPDAGTVLLTRQFRLPIYLNGHPDGMLIEAAAGLLDEPGEDPEAAIRGRPRRRAACASATCSGCSGCT